MVAPSRSTDPSQIPLAANLGRAPVRTSPEVINTNPEVINTLPTAIQAENVTTNPTEVSNTGLAFCTPFHKNLHLKNLVSALKQRDRDDAATLITNLDASRRGQQCNWICWLRNGHTHHWNSCWHNY